MAAPSVPIAVIMERRALASRWQSEKWQPVGIVPDPGGDEPRVLLEEEACTRVLYPGFVIELHRDEAEGYFLNLSTATPYVFVMWRIDEGRAAPKLVTVSYNEASRMMDGGEQVDGVFMPRDLQAWVSAFVAEHYKPEPKKRIRPPSFKGAQRG
jgi:hypothetical protein